MPLKILLALFAFVLLSASCRSPQTSNAGAPPVEPSQTATPVNTPARAETTGEAPPTRITSTAFEDGGAIPARFTCDGQNVSPPLNWTGAPAATKTFALVADDPDSPAGTWVHWVAYNLPATTNGLPANVPATETLEGGARQGTNDFSRLGYGGPCPPSGAHRYFFKLYALDAQLDLAPGATKDQLLEAMKGHVLALAELMGSYERR